MEYLEVIKSLLSVGVVEKNDSGGMSIKGGGWVLNFKESRGI